MIVRPATLSDTPAMVEILNEIIKIGGTTAYETPVSPTHLDRFVTSDDPKVHIFVAETSGTIVGYQWIEPLDSPEDDCAGIATFAKVRAVQKGIGTALFAATKEAATKAGYRVIHALIRADNTGGLAYYSKMGCKDHSVVKDVPLKDGTPVDRIVKRLVL